MKQVEHVSNVWHIDGLGHVVVWEDGGHDLVRRGQGKKWQVFMRNQSNGYDEVDRQGEHAQFCRSAVARSRRKP